MKIWKSPIAIALLEVVAIEFILAFKDVFRLARNAVIDELETKHAGRREADRRGSNS